VSLATIIKKIEDEAEAQRQQIIDHANAEAEQIVEQGRKRAEDEAAHILQKAEDELHNVKNRRMATTLLHMRKEKLDHRQQILNEVFTKALTRIQSYNPEQYRDGARKLLLSVNEEREGTVFLSQTDHAEALIDQAFIDAINEELQQQQRQLRFTLSDQPAEIEHGFVVDFDDFVVNYSIETLLAGLWEEIKTEVSRQLFDEAHLEDE
jgi:V/A-type H+-transporting ATPase subunit E